MFERRLVALAAGAAVAVASVTASACSPAPEQPFNLEEWAGISSPVPTKEPVARAVVHRGHSARRGESNCSEIAAVVLYVRDDSPGLSYVYSFKQISGKLPQPIFPGGLYRGTPNSSGELEFSFYWFDLEKNTKPFSVEVRVTPHSRSGVPGPSAVVTIESDT